MNLYYIILLLFKLPNLFPNFNYGGSLSSTTLELDDINSGEYYGERVFPCKVVANLKFPAHHALV